MAPKLAVAPGRPFVHLLIPSRRPRWGSLLNRSIFDLSLFFIHRESGEAIPLVNLSEVMLGGIGRDPRFVVAAASEHSPSDAREFVGERDSEEVAVREAFGSLLDPGPESPHRRGGTSLDDNVGGLHKKGAQVLVAALRDPAELGAIAGRLLLGD